MSPWHQSLRRGGGRRENPETPITRQVREFLRLLRIPHLKHWGGPMSEPGVSDIIGALPGARLRPVEDLDGAIGLASATKGSPVADAAEAAGAPDDYVADLRTRPCRGIGT